MKKIVALFLIVSVFSFAFSQTVENTLINEESTKTIGLSFDYLTDGILLFSGLTSFGVTQFLLNTNNTNYPLIEKDKIFVLDSVMTNFTFNSTLSTVSDITEVLAFGLSASAFLSKDTDSVFPFFVTYAEALSFTLASKNALKAMFPRTRPYAYGSGILEEAELSEINESFPSGHTAIAFCSAASISLYALTFMKDEPLTPYIIGSSYALALGTGALRIASGSHYLSDVLTGAILGSAFGFAVPYFHIFIKEDKIDAVSLKALPSGLALVIKF